MTTEITFSIGDLVYYIGPPIVYPTKWDLIVVNNNGIVSEDDIGIIIKLDCFLRIADIFFNENDITLYRVSFSKIKHITA